MIERVRYYLDLLAALCGFDSPEEISTFGIVMVALAAATLIFACYRALTLTLWPGEKNVDHIKRRVLEDEEACNAN